MADLSGENPHQPRISSFFRSKSPRKRPAEASQDTSEPSTAVDPNSQAENIRYTKMSKTESQTNLQNADSDETTRARRRMSLRMVAQETKNMLPSLLLLMPHAPPTGYHYPPGKARVFDPKYCPGLKTKVQVLDGDTFDTAINFANAAGFLDSKDAKNVCVLNMANQSTAGGGWVRGALAQEEALCYRSSLSFTLKLRYYPLEDLGAIYSPNVVIFRDSINKGHKLMDLTMPEFLPIVSAISIAALQNPPVDRSVVPPKYKNIADRDLMKEKMRVILRVAGFNKHRRLVLGAFGCGAFANPQSEVADCWAEVLQENEFKGWFENIVFAIIDDKAGIGNLDIFRKRLHGLTM